MDGETKSGPLTRQSDHLHTWKGSSTGRLRLETVSLIAANMCQENRLSRRLGEAEIQEKRVAINEMWFNRLGEVIRWPRVATKVATEAPFYGSALGPKNGSN